MAAELQEIDTVELEQQALTWPERAKAIIITDQVSYTATAGLLINIADLERQIIDHHKPIKDAAYAAHKAACAAEKRLLDPLALAKSTVKRSIAGWEVEQERIRREAERQAEEAARKAEEEARISLAVEAEAAGASEETTQEILATPIPMTRPVAVPTFQRAEGVSTQQRWKADLVDIKALCRAIADGRASTELVQPNMVALNAMARAMKSTFNVPGVRAVPETSVAVRRG